MRFIRRFREWLEYRRDLRRTRREYLDMRQADAAHVERERFDADPYGRGGGGGFGP